LQGLRVGIQGHKVLVLEQAFDDFEGDSHLGKLFVVHLVANPQELFQSLPSKFHLVNRLIFLLAADLVKVVLDASVLLIEGIQVCLFRAYLRLLYLLIGRYELLKFGNQVSSNR
jgi:hypothetical protein